MDEKSQLLTVCRDEFQRWEELLAGLSEAQITAPVLPGGWSLMDVMAHLMAWQQRTAARLEAGQGGTEPELPGWPEDLDPESEADLDAVNAWIYNRYREHTWPRVYQAWREGYLRCLALGESIPETDLFAKEKFAWLGEYSLADVLLGSYQHHHEEHLEPLLEWLDTPGNLPNAD